MNRLYHSLYPLSIFLLLSPGAALAQTSEEGAAATRFESLASRAGELVVKEFFPVATIQGSHSTRTKVEAVRVSIPGSSSAYAIRLEIDGERTGVLDLDEVQALKRALDQMITRAPEMAQGSLDYAEVIFRSRGNVQVGFFQKDRKQDAFLRVSLQRGGSMFLPVAGLSQIRDAIVQGEARLRELGAR
jgi:hypothetical protein